MNEEKLKFGIDITKNDRGIWSFGVCLSHYEDETYIYANFYRYSITIGKFYKFL